MKHGFKRTSAAIMAAMILATSGSAVSMTAFAQGTSATVQDIEGQNDVNITITKDDKTIAALEDVDDLNSIKDKLVDGCTVTLTGAIVND